MGLRSPSCSLSSLNKSLSVWVHSSVACPQPGQMWYSQLYSGAYAEGSRPSGTFPLISTLSCRCPPELQYHPQLLFICIQSFFSYLNWSPLPTSFRLCSEDKLEQISYIHDGIIYSSDSWGRDITEERILCLWAKKKLLLPNYGDNFFLNHNCRVLLTSSGYIYIRMLLKDH